jgi:hypothetical protein
MSLDSPGATISWDGGGAAILTEVDVCKGALSTEVFWYISDSNRRTGDRSLRRRLNEGMGREERNATLKECTVRLYLNILWADIPLAANVEAIADADESANRSYYHSVPLADGIRGHQPQGLNSQETHK